VLQEKPLFGRDSHLTKVPAVMVKSKLIVLPEQTGLENPAAMVNGLKTGVGSTVTAKAADVICPQAPPSNTT